MWGSPFVIPRVSEGDGILASHLKCPGCHKESHWREQGSGLQTEATEPHRESGLRAPQIIQ